MYVDNKLLTLEEIKTERILTPIEISLIIKSSSEFQPNVRFKILKKGLSTAIKIIMKPYTMMPYLIKIDAEEEILKEYNGDNLVRLKIPSTNIPSIKSYYVEKSRAAIVYSYLIGDRVSDEVDRLDLYLGRVLYYEDEYDEDENLLPRKIKSIESNFREKIFHEILDNVLKKCHWLDAQFEMKELTFPPMTEPTFGFIEDSYRKEELMSYYNRIKEIASKLKAPHGIIHGDLHPKNILVSKSFDPIIIDFAKVRESACVFFDYAKLEVFLQFQLKSDFTNQFFKKGLHLRTYSNEPLILPRSHHGVALYIHTIRTILWKTCLSNTVKMNYETIDIVYRCYLIYFLVRYALGAKLNHENREIAYQEASSLMKYFNSNEI